MIILMDALFSWKVFPGGGRKAMCVHLSFSMLPTAQVCNNVLLRCQNGGVCHHHQHCQCPAGFGGILCEKAQCQGDYCEEQQSSQPALRPPPVGQTLPLALLSLIPSLLATRGLTSLWGERFCPKDILNRGSNPEFLIEDTSWLKRNAPLMQKKKQNHKVFYSVLCQLKFARDDG